MGWEISSISGIGAARVVGPSPSPSDTERSMVSADRSANRTPPETTQMRRQRLADQITDAAGVQRGNLVIEKDEDADRFVYKIVDPDSGTVIRQWPDEDWLRLARSFSEAQPGLWVDQTA